MSTDSNREILTPREALAQSLWNATRAQEPENFAPTVMSDLGSCLHVADALHADGYGKLEITDEMVEKAREALEVRHWDGEGCGSHGSNACSNCHGPSPFTAEEVVGVVLRAALGVRR